MASGAEDIDPAPHPSQVRHRAGEAHGQAGVQPVLDFVGQHPGDELGQILRDLFRTGEFVAVMPVQIGGEQLQKPQVADRDLHRITARAVW
nr:hypothetical protein [Rhodococcus pyridinivorans]